MTHENRYYFKDAISALWMHLHHGLKFEAQDGLYIDYIEKDNEWRFCSLKAREERGLFAEKKFYVRSGQNKLLEPEEGDVGQDRLGMICWFLEAKWHFDAALEEESAFSVAEPVRILIRSGEPFIYPNVEKVKVEKVAAKTDAFTEFPLRYVTKDYHLPAEGSRRDVRPIKNVGSKPIEIKNYSSQTLRLLNPQEIYDAPDIFDANYKHAMQRSMKAG